MAEHVQTTSGETAARIRTAALEAIKDIPGAVLGDGEINEIIRQTGAEKLSVAELTTRAAGLATEFARSHTSKPVNVLNATPDEIDRMRAAQGLPPLLRGAHAAARLAGAAEGDDRQANSGSYSRMLATSADAAFLKSVGLNDATGRALAALGFTTPDQLRQIVHDANTLGLAPNAAAIDLGGLRKAEGARTDGHIGALKRYGDGLRELSAEQKEINKINDPAERAERQRRHDETQRQREEELKAHRDNNVQTPEGKKRFDRLRDQIRAQDKRRVQLEGDQKVPFGETHEARLADNQSIVRSAEIDARHRATVAAVRTNPANGRANIDELAMLAEAKPDPVAPTTQLRASAALQPSAGKPSPTPTNVANGAKPTQQQQVVNQKALNPSV